MSTVQSIVVAAYGYSNRNLPDVLATAGFQAELTARVAQLQRALYALAARTNPTAFAGFQDVAFVASPDGEIAGWPRPDGAYLIFRIEQTDSGGERTEVVQVGYDDRAAETGLPAVYPLGQTFFPAGNPLDPTGGTLRFFFARVPTDPVAFTDPLDIQWITSFDTLLAVQVAEYLAAKDGRTDEMAGLQADEAKEMALFLAYLADQGAYVRRRFAAVRRAPSPSVAPVTAA